MTTYTQITKSAERLPCKYNDQRLYFIQPKWNQYSYSINLEYNNKNIEREKKYEGKTAIQSRRPADIDSRRKLVTQ